MQKSFNTIGLAAIAAAFAFTPAIGSAQETAAPGTPPTSSTGTDMQTMPPTGQTSHQPPMTHTTPNGHADLSDAEKDSLMAAWPEDRKTAFKQWPEATQNYFWSLTPQRQNIFWALSDGDKVTLGNMPEQQRESTWAQIESQMTPPQN